MPKGENYENKKVNIKIKGVDERKCKLSCFKYSNSV